MGLDAGGLAPLSQLSEQLLHSDEHFDRCAPDRATAQAQLDRLISNECEDTLHAASQGRWQKANTYSYDAARKAVSALLLAHGWRVKNMPGAHRAVGGFVDVWLGGQAPPGPRIAQTFGASRKARHDDEYPARYAPERSDRELQLLAEDNIRLMNAAREAVGLEVFATLVPTQANVAGRGRLKP